MLDRGHLRALVVRNRSFDTLAKSQLRVTDLVATMVLGGIAVAKCRVATIPVRLRVGTRWLSTPGLTTATFDRLDSSRSIGALGARQRRVVGARAARGECPAPHSDAQALKRQAR